jgi:hypothetical protein
MNRQREAGKLPVLHGYIVWWFESDKGVEDLNVHYSQSGQLHLRTFEATKSSRNV